MAAAELATRPADRQPHRRGPFTAWVKRIANVGNKKGSSNAKSKKAHAAAVRNNPYPESGHVPHQSQSRFSSTNDYSTVPSRRDNDSYDSLPAAAAGHAPVLDSNRSAAPTVATNPDTIHSDAGYSKALTGTTAGGALSSIDGAGANSTFSSPNQSQQSLTTTLTTIQSTNPLNPSANSNSNSNMLATPQTGLSSTHPSATQSPVQFAHQYPITSQPASAIPAHLTPTAHNPTTYSSATAGNLLTDDASILTLASSSKRRRRSFDTDASVRALAPRSVWGDSRESLPLSVLSGNADRDHASSRPGVSGLAAERASVYSSQGISAPALTSERNSYYASSKKEVDARSLYRDVGADGRSVNFDGKSLGGNEGGSLRGYEGSIRSGALGHGRNDSIPGGASPLHSPVLLRQPSNGVSFVDKEERDVLTLAPDEEDEEQEEAAAAAEQAEQAVHENQHQQQQQQQQQQH
ncbi:hypothetical protein MBLNU459_g2533t1 [Dothideomycetes sp. NU459]